MLRIDRLQQLAERTAWVIAPVGELDLPLSGGLAVLDFWARDPVAKAVRRGFFAGRAGETLLVPPGELPIAGLLVVGYGKGDRGWEAAVEGCIEALPEALPGKPETACVLAPEPLGKELPVPWAKAAERFVPRAQARVPHVRRWLWLDLLEDSGHE